MQSYMRVFQAFAVSVALLLLSGCDVHYRDDDDDDDYPHYVVTANMTVEVLNGDTLLPVEGAIVRFYGDHGWEWDLDLNDSYVSQLTDSNGIASVSIQAVLSHPNQCIGLWARAEYSDWTTGRTNVVKFWYPSGGSYTTTVHIYVDSSSSTATTVVANTASDTLMVPSCEYETIQSAIDAAKDGDWIVVDIGRYEENLDFQGKDVVLASMFGPELTIIDGDDKGPAVKFASDATEAVVLDGFTILGGKPGVQVAGAMPTLGNNVIVSNIDAKPQPPGQPVARRTETDSRRAPLKTVNIRQAVSQTRTPLHRIPILMFVLLALLLAAGSAYYLRRRRAYS